MAEVTISREAVELAARTLVDSGAVSGKGWDDLQPAAKFAWAQRARKALQAAAPHIVAAAYEGVADELSAASKTAGSDNIDKAMWTLELALRLRSNAAELRAQS